MIEQAISDFFDTLGRERRRAAFFPFASDERRNWHYIPKNRTDVRYAAVS
jgi:peptidase E